MKLRLDYIATKRAERRAQFHFILAIISEDSSMLQKPNEASNSFRNLEFPNCLPYILISTRVCDLFFVHKGEIEVWSIFIYTHMKNIKKKY
jgi:hypothetical protein